MIMIANAYMINAIYMKIMNINVYINRAAYMHIIIMISARIIITIRYKDICRYIYNNISYISLWLAERIAYNISITNNDYIIFIIYRYIVYYILYHIIYIEPSSLYTDYQIDYQIDSDRFMIDLCAYMYCIGRYDIIK